MPSYLRLYALLSKLSRLSHSPLVAVPFELCLDVLDQGLHTANIALSPILIQARTFPFSSHTSAYRRCLLARQSIAVGR
jgi:hypothetical protein